VSFFKDLKSLVREDADSPTLESAVNEENPMFVYVKMPVDLDPTDRDERFAEPLQEALERENLGAVTGGGSMEPDPDELGEEYVFSGIDVNIFHAGKGLVLLRNELIRLNAPPGTSLLYELNGQELEEPIYPANVH
jgi:hypothetical protein